MTGYSGAAIVPVKRPENKGKMKEKVEGKRNIYRVCSTGFEVAGHTGLWYSKAMGSHGA